MDSIPSDENSMLEASKNPGDHEQLKDTKDTEDSEDIEEDVKVCDICGDAGIEELLAVCTRCSDGAEHTYCMQKKLKKIPEGEWLCEECKIKEETKNKNAKESEIETSPRVGSPIKNNKNTESDFDPKPLPALDTKAADQEERGAASERPQSPHIPTKTQEDKLKDDVKKSKGVLESHDASTRAADGKNKSLLTHEGSFSSLVAEKLKQAKSFASFGGQTLNNSSFARSQTFSGPSSKKMLDPPQSLRGPLAKSGSFNNSNMKPKVQFIENVPRKTNISRDLNDTRRGQVRKMSESASIKSFRSSCSNGEPIIKSQPLQPPEHEDHRRIKEKNTVEMRNSSQELPLIDLPPMASVSSLRPTFDPKVVSMSEVKVTDTDRGLLDKNNAGCNEVKSAFVSKNIGQSSSILTAPGISSASERPFNIPGTVLQQDKIEKVKDGSILGTKQAATSGSGILRCRKCNETGHPTQFCPIDKLSLTALKPSGDRNVRDPYNKLNKLKDGAGEATLKSVLHKDGRLPKHSEKLLIPSAPNAFQTYDLNEAAASVDQNLLDLDVSYPDKMCDSNPVITVSDQLTAPSVPTDILRSSVIPELKFIWQGGFEVLKSGMHSKSCEGVQAHLSTYASPKVVETAVKFPCKVQLEEVTFLSSWPCQLKEDSPGEHNIALFFFAKDTDSYEKNYSKLLENMIKNDLALKGNIAGAELLIFPSNKLPQNAQRWNRLFFLWGVFKARGSICSEAQSGPFVQDLPNFASEVITSQKLNSNLIPNEVLTSSNQFTELKTVEPIPDIQMNASYSCSGVENEIDCLKNFDLEDNEVVNRLSLDEKMEGGKSLGISNFLQGKDPSDNITELSPNRKRSLPTPTEPVRHAVGAISDCLETMQLNEKAHFLFADDRIEHKKMKLGGNFGCSLEENLNTLPTGLTINSFDRDMMEPEGSKTDERSLFCMETNLHVQSSDGDGPPDTNLELALGGNKKSSVEEIPVQLPSKGGDDVAASLSLSLSFNALEKDA